MNMYQTILYIVFTLILIVDLRWLNILLLLFSTYMNVEWGLFTYDYEENKSF